MREPAPASMRPQHAGLEKWTRTGGSWQLDYVLTKGLIGTVDSNLFGSDGQYPHVPASPAGRVRRRSRTVCRSGMLQVFIHPFDPTPKNVDGPDRVARKMAWNGVRDELNGHAVILQCVIHEVGL